MADEQTIRRLRARRALSRRAKPGPVPRQQEPRGARFRYRRALKAIQDEFEKLIVDRLFSKLPEWAEEAQTNFDSVGLAAVDSFGLAAVDSVSAGWNAVERRDQGGLSEKIFATFETLRVAIGEIVPETEARDLATKIVNDVNATNRREIKRQFESLLGINPFSTESGLREILNLSIRQNIRLIRSIPFQQLDTMEDIVAQGIRSGREVGALRDDLERRFGVARSRADLIARDQVNKLNGQLTKFRQRDAGVRRYRWSTSQDERVRPSHARLHGKIFSWDDPPSVGHPGEDYQCRCNAVPLVDELLEELEAS